MKNLLMSFAAFVVLALFSPGAVLAEGVLPESKKPPVESAETLAMKSRIQEIRALDRSTLSRADKKELRTELKAMKATAAGNNNGIYLSLGAIIVVILLLILLL